MPPEWAVPWHREGRGAGGVLGPLIILTGTFNLFSGHALHARISSVQCVRFGSIKRQKYLFIYCYNKETLLDINALGRLKMLFRRPYISKSSWEDASRSPSPHPWLTGRAFGERGWPHQINLTLLRHWWVGDIARSLLVLSATINIWGGAQSIKGFATLKNVVNLQFISEVRPDLPSP